MSERRCVNCMELIDEKTVYCAHCGYHLEKEETIPFSLKENTILRGRYLVGRVLGQGGFGITYVGYDLALDIKVAIKEYFPMGMAVRNGTVSNQILWNTTQISKEQWQRGCDSFLKEARRMAKIDSLPGIVRVRDTFPENQTAYIVMDFVEGKNLKQHLRENGVMAFPECLDLLIPLMTSLDKVHKLDLIHRDISPDNIMLQPNGSLCLLDFGAAKDVSLNQNAASQQVTKKGFSPPEQYMENGRIGTWTDVYAMCATMYYCITGKLVPDAMERMWDDQLRFDVPMKTPLSEELITVFRRGLELRPEQRIQTIDELVKLFTPSISVKTEEQKRIEEEQLKMEAEKRRLEELKEAEERRRQEEIEQKRAEEKRRQEALMREEAEKKRKQETPMPESVVKEISKSEIEADRETDGFDEYLKMQEEKRRERKKWIIGILAAIAFLLIILRIIFDPYFVWDWRMDESGEGYIITEYYGKSDEIKIPKEIFGKDVVNVKNNMDVFAFEVDEDHPYLTAVEGVLFNKDMTTIVAYPRARYDNHYEVPDGVVTIQDSAFKKNKLETISLPDSIEILEENAFFSSDSLEEIVIPKGVQEIGDHCFFYCLRLNYVVIPESVKEIGGWAFSSSYNLQSVTIAEDCIVEDYAFDDDVVINYYEPNFLMADNVDSTKVLGSEYSRYSIRSIQFVDSLQKIPEEAEFIWDVSEQQNGSVMAGVVNNGNDVPYDLYIAADGTISAIEGERLFAHYWNVTEIEFNDCFSTRHVTNMRAMFFDCERLETVNVSSFNTQNVEDMAWMFGWCVDLKELDLAHFDVSNVEDMQHMFDSDESLMTLNLEGWNLDSVDDTTDMFEDTDWDEADFE